MMAGSAFLLLGSLSAYPRFPPVNPPIEWVLIFVLSTSVAAILHLVGWMHLYVATRIACPPAIDSGQALMSPHRAFQASVILFGGLLATLPFQLERIAPLLAWLSSDSYGGALLSALLFGFLYVPYLPLMFGPVVIFHAYIFGRGVPRLSGEARNRFVLSGALVLMAIAVTAISVQLATLSGVSIPPEVSFLAALPFPAGATVVGYGVLLYAFGLSRTLDSGKPRPLESSAVDDSLMK